MKNTQHLKRTLLSGFQGVNQDVSPDMFSTLKGKAYSMTNARVDKRRQGEVVPIGNDKILRTFVENVYPVNTARVFMSGECVYSVYCGEYKVSLWNTTAKGQAVGSITYAYGVIIVDGEVVLMSTEVSFVGDKLSVDIHPGDTSEIYITDGTHLPLILDVKDMVTEATKLTHGVHSEKYFSEFLPKNYGPTFNSNVGKTVFVELKEVGSGAGVKIGANIYFYRLVDTEGNRTGWGIPSPIIPVIANEDLNEYHIPLYSTADKYGWKTYGGVSGESSKYGVHIRMRIINRGGFSYVEVGRLSYTSGGPLGDIATFGVTPVLTDMNGGTVDITKNFVQSLDFIDTQSVVWETSDEVLASQLSVIKSADALRYFADRLIYFGVTYEDYDLTGDFAMLHSPVGGNEHIYPVVKDLKRIGHRSVYNQVEYKSEMHNERRNFAIVFHDGKGGTTPPIPKSELENFRFPCQREAMGTSSVETTEAINDSTFSIGMTTCIRTDNTLGYGFPAWTDVNAQLKGGYRDVSIADGAYDPFTPVNRFDKRVNHRVNTNIDRVYSTDTVYSSTDPRSTMRGFNPKFMSLGVAIAGIDVSALPDWVKGFSVVQSQPSSYVVAQGIGVYSIENLYNSSISATACKKDLNGLIAFFPDLDARIGLYPSVMTDLKNNPSAYQIQLVAPVGFFSEAFIPELGKIYEKDILTHATVMRAVYPNATDLSNKVGDGTTGHVIFGKYRDDTITNPLTLGTTPESDLRYSVLSAEELEIHLSYKGDDRFLGTSRNTIVKLTLDTDIYATEDGTNTKNSETARPFHEPFYIINLVRTGAAIPKGNTSIYQSTGHYQKLQSDIGEGTGESLIIDLVDERVTDYVYVNNQLWVCYNYFGSGHIAADAALVALNAETPFTDEWGNTVHGVVRYKQVGNRYQLVFSEDGLTSANSDYLIPALGDLIEVRYNSNSPLVVFGGDYVVSENVGAIVDVDHIVFEVTESDTLGCTAARINCAFPYAYFKVSGIDKVDTLKVVRQWLVESVLLTRTNTPFITNDAYPNRAYEVKPGWEKSFSNLSNYNKGEYLDFAADCGVDPQWVTDYKDDLPNLFCGGFVLPQAINSDYSKKGSRSYATIPAVGFTPKTYFPNRVHWSVTRNASVQDTPNIKTFLATAVWDMDGKQGSITRAFDTRGAGGYDLFVFTEHGLCRLLTNRQMITTTDGNNLGVLPKEGAFVQGEDWLNKSVGIPKALTRLAVEHQEQLFFVGEMEVYQFGEQGVQPISEGFKRTLMPWISGMLGSVTVKDMGATGHEYYDEILFLYDGTVYAYNYATKAWMGTRTYTGIDKMLGDKVVNGLYGFNYSTYLREYTLDTSLASPNTYKDFVLELIAADSPSEDKEFVSITLIGDVRPDSVEFRTNVDGAAEAILSSAYPVADPPVVNNLYMKHYGNGWWAYVPRALAGARYREQGNYLVTKVKHNTQISGLNVKFVEIGWKPIK